MSNSLKCEILQSPSAHLTLHLPGAPRTEHQLERCCRCPDNPPHSHRILAIKSSAPSQTHATARCLTRTHAHSKLVRGNYPRRVQRSPIAPNSHSRTICGIVRYVALTQAHLHTYIYPLTWTHTHTNSLLSFSHVASSMQTTFCRNSSFLGLRFIFMADPYLLWDWPVLLPTPSHPYHYIYGCGCYCFRRLI